MRDRSQTQPPICVDDYGCEVFHCHFSGEPISAAEAQIVGATIPGVKARYVVSQRSAQARKASAAAFHESEANCNTCRHLIRVKHQRRPDGFMHGKCGSGSGQPQSSPYSGRFEDAVMVFHPDDPMHMPCYETRFDPC